RGGRVRRVQRRGAPAGAGGHAPLRTADRRPGLTGGFPPPRGSPARRCPEHRVNGAQWCPVSAELIVLVLVIVVALAFDFTNGFHDTANAMATSIATGALKPRTA